MATTAATEAQLKNSRRLVLLPLPFQGHINPMLQLANILYSKGFTITVLHTLFNSPDPLNFPNFTFLPIPGTGFGKQSLTDVDDVIRFVRNLNDNCVDPITETLGGLMREDEGVACLITDAQWYATQSVADRLKIPRIVHRTSSVSSFLTFAAFPSYLRNGHLPRFSDEDLKSEELVPELQPVKFNDLPKLVTSNPKATCELLDLMVNGCKPARAMIWNTFKELEQPALPTLSQHFPNPHFMIGPFHKSFKASSSSLLAQDQTSISWLDRQAPKSVLYVSFGSLAGIEKAEFLEIAWGLANSKQPFLWVVRPGLVGGSEWLELLPDGFLEKVGERGYIVKWAPQQEVLAHWATGGFWTHNGWNSTLESVCEGVPMICSPFFGDQPPNARYVCDVWGIGVHLENRLERGAIEGAIKRLMVDQEGLEMRDRVMGLKEKVSHCLAKGGSSWSSLEALVNFILSF